MPALATWAPEDGVLGAVAPLALAAAQPTTLVVDLDPNGPRYPSERSLRALVDEGPRASDLGPNRRGVAVLANGGVAPGAAAEMVQLLLRGWPAVVIRLGPQAPDAAPVPLVPVRLLAPGRLFPRRGPGVYQPLGGFRVPRRRPERAGSVVLPAAPRRVITTLLAGGRPTASRWLAAWGPVWEMAW